MALTGPSAGVNLVTQHSHWDNIFQELRGKVTLELCGFGYCREKIFEISANDIIGWAVAVSELMTREAVALKVPIPAGGAAAPDGYVPLQEGPMAQDANLADTTDFGSEVPPYEYIEPEE